MRYKSRLDSPLLDTDDRFRRSCIAREKSGRRLTTGYVRRDWRRQPAGTIECCEAYDPSRKIDRSLWDGILEQREREQSTLKQVGLDAGIRTVSQNGVPHCWAFGSVRAVELVEAISGEKHVPLSPTSVACVAKNFRRVGGNTFDTIPVMTTRGIVTAENWPINNFNRDLDNEEAWRDGLRFALKRWMELPRNDFDAAASELLRGFPVILGVPWGRGAHMIVGTDLKALGAGRYGIEIWNSHGVDYGEDGFAVLPENRATAFDQAVCMTSEV